MEHAYGQVVVALENCLLAAGVVLPPTPKASTTKHPLASYKRALLDAAAARFGATFLEQMGRRFASERSHPFICALRAAKTVAQLLMCWQRLEVLAHSENRVEVVGIDESAVRLVRRRRSGGAPTPAEDALVLGLLAGVLEAQVSRKVEVASAPAGQPAGGGRGWVLRWVQRSSLRPTGSVASWGGSSDFARAAFALVLDDTTAPLASIARRLCLTPRSLQRRLREVDTSYRNLVRTARVVLAGQSLVRALPARTSLSSVAYACGFSDSAHLSREFRALVGVQPKQFAKAIGP